MHLSSHHIVGLIEIEAHAGPSPLGTGSLGSGRFGDETLSATLARLAVCAAADLDYAEGEDLDDLDDSLDGDRSSEDRESSDTPLFSDPLRGLALGEPVVCDLPRLLCELSLLYTMVRGDALLKRFAAR